MSYVAEHKIKHIVKALQSLVEQGNDTEKRFVESIQKNGLEYALSWADGNVRPLEIRVYAREALRAHEEGTSLVDALTHGRDFSQEKLMRFYAKRSTSLFSNAVELEKQEAYREIYEQFNGMLKYLTKE